MQICNFLKIVLLNSFWMKSCLLIFDVYIGNFASINVSKNHRKYSKKCTEKRLSDRFGVFDKVIDYVKDKSDKLYYKNILLNLYFKLFFLLRRINLDNLDNPGFLFHCLICSSGNKCQLLHNE